MVLPTIQYSNPLQVRYADGEIERIGVFTTTTTESELWFCLLLLFLSLTHTLHTTHYTLHTESKACVISRLINHTLVHTSDHKLFVGKVPRTVIEQDLYDMFQPYGTIEQLNILEVGAVAENSLIHCIIWHHDLNACIIVNFMYDRGPHLLTVPLSNTLIETRLKQPSELWTK